MPTLLQKRASKLVDKGGNYKEIMTKAGYSPNTIHTPQKLTESKGWIKLLEKDLPDTKLTKIHKQVLRAKKIVTSPTGPDKLMPDWTTRVKGLELAYKVKHKLTPDILQQFNTGGEMKIEFVDDSLDTNGNK